MKDTKTKANKQKKETPKTKAKAKAKGAEKTKKNERASTARLKAEMLRAMEASLCNISEAAAAVGIGRCAYYEWLKADEDFARSIENLQEAQIDFAESCLLERIKSGDTTAIIFYLKTRGKKRGYSEKLEIEARLTPFEQLMIETEDDTPHTPKS